MGLTFSAPVNEESMSNQVKVQNIQALANANVEENNILDTLNLSELNPTVKKEMPLVGGNDYTSEGDFAYNFPQKKVQRKERYNNYDLFNVMAELENKNNLVGGNLSKDDVNRDDLAQSTSTDPGMSALKNIIQEEMNKYKNNKSENGSLTGGGDCGCSGNNNILEGGKKKKNKSKKSKKVMKGGISTSSSTESSVINYKLDREEIANATSNEELEEGKGLSIFPLNSSDVSNQTSSERNFRMIRRKI
jgi:hypothetical protein